MAASQKKETAAKKRLRQLEKAASKFFQLLNETPVLNKTIEGFGESEVGIIGGSAVPYIPTGLVPIENLRPNVLPYIGQVDLIAFKASCCGRRADWRNEEDARDAFSLIKTIAPDGRIIQLKPHQAKPIHNRLEALAFFSKEPEDRWMNSFEIVLGLDWALKIEL
ncbi:hypothetical protein PHISCL_08723 [Aspergillus sclerotialis]|uniref:Uncharacterized protein n=1 Tax=Aspergillus sclerotialis TaxID=2070753 RepID=A0A3A2Z7R7_9EURO|nr:hypothetical protein PHISCL_08723 [Aspergillus sclerotialis]